mgnify:CR=1 FL=1
MVVVVTGMCGMLVTMVVLMVVTVRGMLRCS